MPNFLHHAVRLLMTCSLLGCTSRAPSSAAQPASLPPPAPAPAPEVRVQLLAINDFHGRLTEGLRVQGRPVGGAAVLAAYLRAERDAFAGSTLFVHAGDHVGGSPPESALLQDEPSIELLNLLGNTFCTSATNPDPRCNVVGTLGNHEFDEGVPEILRLLRGGNHPNGPFLSDPWRGARFPYVSANVANDDTGATLLPPYALLEVQGLRIALIGAVLEGTPHAVEPEDVRGVRFGDEADAINAQVRELAQRGVHASVVLIHQGGAQPRYEGPTQPEVAGPGGEIADIVARLDSEVDVVVSGHAHNFTNALMKNTAGHPILVTQAYASGTAYGDIELTLDAVRGDVIAKSARIVTTFADEGPGLTPAADVAALVERARARVASQVSKVLGRSDTAIVRAANASGESALGNLIADAQRKLLGTDLAFMNPGGVRADLDAGPITWGELFTIQPFGNALVRMQLRGSQVRALLEQQWSDPGHTRMLSPSGLSLTWRADRPAGERIERVTIQGRPLEPERLYSVAVNSFLASGGDGFSVFGQGLQRTLGPVDLDALIAFVAAQPGPIQAGIDGRIQRAAP